MRVQALDLFKCVEDDPYRAGYVPPVVIQGLLLDYVLAVISPLLGEFEFREEVANNLSDFLHNILRLFNLPKCGNEKHYPIVLLRTVEGHLEGDGASEAVPNQELLRVICKLFGDVINKAFGLADDVLERLDIASVVAS